jgi:uncharacterized protein with GYD domain
MPKYLIAVSYTADGLKGLHKDKPSGRKKAVTAALESLGGKLDAIYYALGKYDVYVIADLPDAASVAALSIAVSGTGLAHTHTTTLLTVAEADKAIETAVKYRGPGH